MTATSFASTKRSVFNELEKTRPDIKVKKLAMERLGKIRLCKVTLENGEYLQFQLPPLGTHALNFSDCIVKHIVEMVPNTEVSERPAPDREQ